MNRITNMKKKTITLLPAASSAARSAAAGLMLLLLLAAATSCTDDNALTRGQNLLQPGTPEGNALIRILPPDPWQKPPYNKASNDAGSSKADNAGNASGSNADSAGGNAGAGNAATRTNSETGKWEEGDVVTVTLQFYAKGAQSNGQPIEATPGIPRTQTLTYTKGSDDDGSTPKWTAVPPTLPVPADAYSLIARYRYTGAPDPRTATSEQMTGEYPDPATPITGQTQPGVTLASLAAGTNPGADTDPNPGANGGLDLTLPSPSAKAWQWTRTTTLVTVTGIQPGHMIEIKTTATTSGSSDEGKGPGSSSKPRIYPSALHPADADTTATANFHIEYTPDTKFAVTDPAMEALGNLDTENGGIVAEPKVQSLYKQIPLTPGENYLYPAQSLYAAGTGSGLQAVVGDGKKALDLSLFNAQNPVWVVTGDNRGKEEADESTDDVLKHVRTALDNIHAQHSHDDYNGTAAIDLTLTEVTALPYINNYGALQSYRQLRSISLPAAKIIGQAAFYYCTALTAASLPAAETIGESAFQYCTTLTTISLPAATDIRNEAFYYCTALTTASLPLATGIGNEAFYDCMALTAANLPLATSIGDHAFEECIKLTTIDLPVAETIGENAFKNCSALTAISLPAAKSIGQDAFTGCYDLTTVSLPMATKIEIQAFNSCAALTAIDLPKATDIGQAAFYYCTALTTASLPKAETIGNNAFESCHALTTVSLPLAKTIGDYAFSSCYALTTISLLVAGTIGVEAFSGCSALATINLPMATSIEDYAFKNCSALTTVNLPAATSIGPHALSDCSSITHLDISGMTGDPNSDGWNFLDDGIFTNAAHCELVLNKAFSPSGTQSDEVTGEGKVFKGRPWKSISFEGDKQ